MNIDDVLRSIPDSERTLREEITLFVDGWKRGSESIDELDYLVRKWHGNVWFRTRENSDNFYLKWCNFKAEVIDGVGGMTVNERLYLFGLIELWDNSNDEYRAILHAKLKAPV